MANSLIVIVYMGKNIRLPFIDSIYSKVRHLNIYLQCLGQTVTDLNTKAKETTTMVYFTLNSSKHFFERV